MDGPTFDSKLSPENIGYFEVIPFRLCLKKITLKILVGHIVDQYETNSETLMAKAPLDLKPLRLSKPLSSSGR